MSECNIPSSGSRGRPPGSTRQRLDNARRAKKRESDRQSQKTMRERTKNYITHLEQLVEALGRSKENGQVEILTQQLQREHEEKEKLKDVITGISRLIRGVEVSDGPKSGGSDSTSSSLLGATATTGFNLYDQVYGEVASSVGSDTFLSGNSLMEERPMHSQAEWQPPASLSVADSWSGLLLPRAISGFEQATPNFEMSIPPTLVLPDELLTNNNNDTNMFAAVDNMLNRVLKLGNSVIRTNILQDADIVIRAILYGWAETEARHTLDIGWQLLRQFESIFSNTGPVERLAILRLLRLKLRQDAVGLGDQGSHSLPSFMAQRPPQSPSTYRTLVDYFAWPGLREFLILEGRYHIHTEGVAKFAASLLFHWPFDLQDVCLRNRHTCLYSFSGAFNERFQDIRWWTLTPEFIQQNPWLSGRFPVYEPSVELLFNKDNPTMDFQPSALSADIPNITAQI